MKWLFELPKKEVVFWAAIIAAILLATAVGISRAAEPVVLQEKETRNGSVTTGVAGDKVVSLRTTRRGRRTEITTGTVGNQVVTVTKRVTPKEETKDEDQRDYR